MNLPTLETQRLLLRTFHETDLDAIFAIFSDAEVNKFLPWFPLKTLAEAEVFYWEQIKSAYNYAVCLKNDPSPIGYVHVSMSDSYDFGYGLCRQFWHKGIATEAGTAVIQQLKNDGIPYITATHDVNNPRSGEVMKRLGMRYCYSYEEQWMPKNILVTFRMYQLNLDGVDDRIYQTYWDNSAVRFVETDFSREHFPKAHILPPGRRY